MRSPRLGEPFALPQPRASALRFIVLALVVIVVVTWIRFTTNLPSASMTYFSPFASRPVPASQTQPNHNSPWAAESSGRHPIDTLISRADEEFADLLKKESKSLHAAVKAYRERRGRHPPPGFDVWFEFAQKHNAVMVEDFFDQVYHDLAPFWGLNPHQIRDEGKRFEMVISIRNGNATTNSDWFWSRIWHDMVSTIAPYLPDLDMALNGMDESRLVVPWEKINEYMDAEGKSRRMPDPAAITSKYTGLADIDAENNNERLNWEWETDVPYFPKARAGCHPDSLARRAEVMNDWTHSPQITMQSARPHSYKGYVSNWTLSTSICHQPDLQSLHGYFIEPLSVRSSPHLMPLFGGSKLATNNEILLPAPMYWGDDTRFQAGDDIPWKKKKDVMIWRGVATGGRNHKDNWQGFHRHRFVAMVNGSLVRKAETWEELPRNFVMPSDLYDVRATRSGHLGDWMDSFADAGFMNLNCWPKEEESDRCQYIGDRMVAVPGMNMSEMFQHKYVPDIDGNSFSGRYRSFLQSGSLPIKATVFREWHDSRIVPWKHFVPLDNRFQDFYGIMEYFLGYPGFDDADRESNARPPNDAAAEKIASEGRDWANRVLRREDMQIYVFRLLLEYARVSDDKRDVLGYVADLL
ncbi:MAG: hypothetical protein M1838_001751 [Thelocarpon superellum]|nr:MAG: hypothetical protein M1838_001751 [Thelocarpon superellum]